MLQYHFNGKKLSVIAGITLWNFYFRCYPGAIRAPQVVAFLKHLLRHIPGKLLLVWDRLPAHRSRGVQEFVAARKGRNHIEYLPAYAPELNPTEYIWGHCKHHKLPNACPQGLRPTTPRRPSRTPKHAPPPHPHHRLLEAGFFVVRVTLYYAGISRRALHQAL